MNGRRHGMFCAPASARHGMVATIATTMHAHRRQADLRTANDRMV
jgi:hypothetical protein